MVFRTTTQAQAHASTCVFFTVVRGKRLSTSQDTQTNWTGTPKKKVRMREAPAESESKIMKVWSERAG